MRIALYTSNRTTIPPEKNVVAASVFLTGVLADGLVEKGHEVTLYAPKGSISKAKIIDLNLNPSDLDFALQPEEWVLKKSMGMKQIYLSELFSRANEYDIIHLQTEPIYLGMPFARLSKTPTIFTNHNPFLEQEKEIFMYYKNLPLISISDAQRKTIPNLNYISTIYDGIDVKKYPFYDANNRQQDYMYFMGRLVANKGVAQAIEVEEKIRRKLLISGVGTQEFIDDVITPHVSENISFLGPIPKESTHWFDFMGNGKVGILPIQWEEPFGLVFIESMACGTPVVAFARGAVPEIIKDGETGFIVNPSDNDIRGNWITKKTGVEGLCEAIEKIYAMPDTEYQKMRRASREHVEKNFTAEKMVDEYEEVYMSIIENFKLRNI